MTWDLESPDACIHGWCGRGKYKDRDVCYAHMTFTRCEVKECDEWSYHPYTTCEKHTRLLKRIGAEPLELMGLQDLWKMRSPMDNNDFRLSASYVSRYNNCHGSANLPEAIPGFVHPERNDGGMKGEGTRLHKIFEVALSERHNLVDKAQLLRELAELWGPKRTAMLEDEKKFIITYFMKHKQAPPIELPILKEGLLQYVPVLDTDANPTDTMVAKGVPPRRIVFLAEALEYVNDLLDEMDDETIEVFIEAKTTATWLTTMPKTTVDLIIRDQYKMHVIDLKMGEIEVSPIGNEQLMYYAETFRQKSAALDLPDEDNWYEDITLHILQRNYTDHWNLPPAVLSEWVEKVKESEQAILDGDLTLSAGEHCKFCPANPASRGDKGSKSCPVMLSIMYGERDKEQSDIDVLEDDDE